MKMLFGTAYFAISGKISQGHELTSRLKASNPEILPKASGKNC
jgi:hypothetical protein